MGVVVSHLFGHSLFEGFSERFHSDIFCKEFSMIQRKRNHLIRFYNRYDMVTF